MKMNVDLLGPHRARLAVALLLTVPAATGCGEGGSAGPASAAGAAGLSAAGGMPGGAPSGGPNIGGQSGGAPSSAGAAGQSPGESGGSTQNAGGASAGQATGGAGHAGSGGAPGPYVPISFGTALEPTAQIAASRELARSLADPSAANWRAKGDQHRTYRFEAAGQDIPYRLCASNDESSYLDQNDKQMVKLAEQHGYVLVSPLGYNGAYGAFLRLPADFSRPDEAAKQLAMRPTVNEKNQELSEQDVINVLELVLNEYPIDPTKMFLTGHSMGSGGTWYLGGKYASYWAALSPMSGPFVLETGYPWENLRDKPVFVTEGLSAATVNGSRAVRDWMEAQGYLVSYREVDADHAGMVPRVLPDVFTFFDQAK
jgi:predicted esterase